MGNKKSIIEAIVELENLHWAWEKVKDFYKDDNYWCDELEITEFQVHYEEELKNIRKDIKNGTYNLSEVKPIFFPKTKNEEDEPLNRQMFWVTIRDQLVWIAVMNVIGKYYDKQMPYWSYGNRLYINIFPDKEKSTDKKIYWEYGPYRNTTKKAYRSFGQSWPRYRKDIYITSKLMTKSKQELEEQLTTDEVEDIERNESLHEIHRVKYKEKGFWKENFKDDIYWCSLDLTKFYPNASTSVILKNFEEYGDAINRRFSDFDKLLDLIQNLLSFQIDYNIHIKDADFGKINLLNKAENFDGIPTGLFVAGFLSNIAMLHIDKALNKVVERKSKTYNKVALFRFVDDFTILSPSFKSIINMINEIEKLLFNQYNDRLKINTNKTKPDELKELLLCKDNEKCKDDIKTLIDKAVQTMKLDSNFPTPLMNHTLKKVSTSNRIAFDLIDSNEEKKHIEDLEHLLVTDISEDEIRRDTRMSFASSRLSNLVPKKKYDYTEIYNVRCKIKNCNKEDEEKLKVLNDKLDIKKTALKEEIQKDRKKIAILLEYAIDNFPDKLKLWKNLINFYKNIGFSESDFIELLQIFKILKNKKEEKEINSYTHEYLVTYIYGVITSAVISSLKSLKSKNISHKEKEIKKSFLEQIFDEKVQKALSSPDGTSGYKSFYFRQSKELLNISIELSKSHYDKTYSISHMLDLDKVHYCWIVNNFGTNLSQPLIKGYFKNTKFDTIYDYYLTSFYPELQIENINEFLRVENNKYLPFSWWYKYFDIHELPNSKYYFNNKNAHKAITLLNYQNDTQFKNIFSFIQDKSINLTEEKVLKIVYEIIKEYNTTSQDLFAKESKSDKVIIQFPYNIYIKDNPKNIKIEIINVEDISLKDKRYFPEFVDFNYGNNAEKQFIYGIGILLYQLISKDLDLLPQFYQPSMQLINSNYFIKELENYHISSYSYEIIKACLSKRNREIEKLNIENKEDNDFIVDNKNLIDIPTIKRLELYISKAIKFLDEQTYKHDKINRALTPKKLFALTSNFDNYTFKDKKDILKLGFIQINFDNMAAWGPSDDITLQIKPEVEDYIWQEVLKGFHKMNNHHTKPDIIVIPELTVPIPYINKLKELAKEINAVVFAGLDWLVDDIEKEIENKAIMIVPNNWNTPLSSYSCNSTFLGKKNPANLEKITINTFNKDNSETYKFIPDDRMYLIDTGEFGKIGFAICADFYDIDRFVVYKGRVQHIFILALNQDTNSFFAISEAIARLVMCNVVICNSGLFGDSLAYSPYNNKQNFKRMIYRNQGANLFATQVVELPVKSLIEDQKQGSDVENIDKIKNFKMPPEYKFIE